MPATASRRLQFQGRGVRRIRENQPGVPAQLASFALEDGPPPPLPLPVQMPAADELQVLTPDGAATNAVATKLPHLHFTPVEPLLRQARVPRDRQALRARTQLRHVLVRSLRGASASTNRPSGCAPADQLSDPGRGTVPDITSAYCTADDRAIVYRLRSDRWEGIAAITRLSRDSTGRVRHLPQASTQQIEQRAQRR
jgi:hypothetical protein